MRHAIKNKNMWNWYASGKHPIFRDYFKMGFEDPLLQAFEDWADSGYRQLFSGKKTAGGHHSWRFWSQGGKKNILICGVARDSSDSLGRPYPLMILGTGPLSGWESNWDLLPYALDGTWSEVEYLACGRFTEIAQLRDGIGRIKLPPPDWPTLASRREMTGTMDTGSQIAGDPHAMANHVKSLIDVGESIVFLDNAIGADSHILAGYWNWALKAHLKIVPKAVFMGGLPDKSFMIVLNRSLKADDFVRLWTIGSQ